MCDASDYAMGAVLGKKKNIRILADLLCCQGSYYWSRELHNNREGVAYRGVCFW